MRTLNTERLMDKPPLWMETVSAFENWYLRKHIHLDPTCERIVRFYTVYEDNQLSCGFKCPTYHSDVFNTLYETFSEASSTLIKEVSKLAVIGSYYYDIKIHLNHPEDSNSSYHWKIVKSDNPKCPYGNHKTRKTVDYLQNEKSNVSIRGYSLSGNYKTFKSVLESMTQNVILVHSETDARAFLKISKFFGVHTVLYKGKYYRNASTSPTHFSSKYFGYQVVKHNGKTVVEVVHKNELCSENLLLLDIDEFIVKRSAKTTIQDFLERF